MRARAFTLPALLTLAAGCASPETPAPPVEEPSPSAAPAMPVRTPSDAERRAIDAAAAAISDRDVAASARRLLRRAWTIPARGNER